MAEKRDRMGIFRQHKEFPLRVRVIDDIDCPRELIIFNLIPGHLSQVSDDGKSLGTSGSTAVPPRRDLSLLF